MHYDSELKQCTGDVECDKTPITRKSVYIYIYQLHSLLHPGKRINKKDLWTKKLRIMIRQKVSYGDGMSEDNSVYVQYKK